MNDTEIVTEVNEDGEPVEWLVVSDRGDGQYVSISREFISSVTKNRKSWQDEGITIEYDCIPAVIAALEKLVRETAE